MAADVRCSLASLAKFSELFHWLTCIATRVALAAVVITRHKIGINFDSDEFGAMKLKASSPWYLVELILSSLLPIFKVRSI